MLTLRADRPPAGGKYRLVLAVSVVEYALRVYSAGRRGAPLAVTATYRT